MLNSTNLRKVSSRKRTAASTQSTLTPLSNANGSCWTWMRSSIPLSMTPLPCSSATTISGTRFYRGGRRPRPRIWLRPWPWPHSARRPSDWRWMTCRRALLPTWKSRSLRCRPSPSRPTSSVCNSSSNAIIRASSSKPFGRASARAQAISKSAAGDNLDSGILTVLDTHKTALGGVGVIIAAQLSRKIVARIGKGRLQAGRRPAGRTSAGPGRGHHHPAGRLDRGRRVDRL